MAKGTCITIKTPNDSTFHQIDSRISNQPESKAMTSVHLVGGILGFIVAVLLILLFLSLIALVLRPNLKKYVIPKTRYVDKTYCCHNVGVRCTVIMQRCVQVVMV